MNAGIGRTAAMSLAVLLLAGCSRGTRIDSDLVLDGHSTARIELHQATDSIELLNDSDAPVRVRILDRKGRLLSNIELDTQEVVTLDIDNARAVQIGNEGVNRAVIRWTLINDDRIEYSMAMDP